LLKIKTVQCIGDIQNNLKTYKEYLN